MKRTDWAEGRQYDPSTVYKPWWTDMVVIKPEDPRWAKMMNDISEAESDGAVWSTAPERVINKPKLKDKINENNR